LDETKWQRNTVSMALRILSMMNPRRVFALLCGPCHKIEDRKLYKAGILKRDGHRRHLTPEEVRIGRMVMAGRSNSEAARLLGWSRQVVIRIKQGKTYREATA
jgi:hypothetical protein